MSAAIKIIGSESFAWLFIRCNLDVIAVACNKTQKAINGRDHKPKLHLIHSYKKEPETGIRQG